MKKSLRWMVGVFVLLVAAWFISDLPVAYRDVDALSRCFAGSPPAGETIENGGGVRYYSGALPATGAPEDFSSALLEARAGRLAHSHGFDIQWLSTDDKDKEIGTYLVWKKTLLWTRAYSVARARDSERWMLFSGKVIWPWSKSEPGS